MSQERHPSNVANGLVEDALEACGAWHASTYADPCSCPRYNNKFLFIWEPDVLGLPSRREL